MLKDNIKIIRKNKGYSQEELASKLHVTRQTISKWENGQSEPSANTLKEMADLYGVSVSELLEGDAERIVENEIIVEQLSRVNEHLVISQKHFARLSVIACCMLVAVVLVAGLIIGIRTFHDKEEKGHRVSDIEHLGELTYQLPGSNYYHADKDIGVTLLPDGSYQISAKTYKCYEDMSEISVWNYGEYDQELIDEFKEKNANCLKEFSDENGDMSDEVSFYISATDAGWDKKDEDVYCGGTFFRAYFMINDNLYLITVLGGTDPLACGQLVVSSLSIDKSLENEFANRY